MLNSTTKKILAASASCFVCYTRIFVYLIKKTVCCFFPLCVGLFFTIHTIYYTRKLSVFFFFQLEFHQKFFFICHCKPLRSHNPHFMSETDDGITNYYSVFFSLNKSFSRITPPKHYTIKKFCVPCVSLAQTTKNFSTMAAEPNEIHSLVCSLLHTHTHYVCVMLVCVLLLLCYCCCKLCICTICCFTFSRTICWL